MKYYFSVSSSFIIKRFIFQNLVTLLRLSLDDRSRVESQIARQTDKIVHQTAYGLSPVIATVTLIASCNSHIHTTYILLLLRLVIQAHSCLGNYLGPGSGQKGMFSIKLPKLSFFKLFKSFIFNFANKTLNLRYACCQC